MTEKSAQTAANVAKIGLIILWAIFMYSIVSCSSHSSKTRYTQVDPKKSINRARRALDKKIQANTSQYAFVNNQIVIFENN